MTGVVRVAAQTLQGEVLLGEQQGVFVEINTAPEGATLVESIDGPEKIDVNEAFALNITLSQELAENESIAWSCGDGNALTEDIETEDTTSSCTLPDGWEEAGNLYFYAELSKDDAVVSSQVFGVEVTEDAGYEPTTEPSGEPSTEPSSEPSDEPTSEPSEPAPTQKPAPSLEPVTPITPVDPKIGITAEGLLRYLELADTEAWITKNAESTEALAPDIVVGTGATVHLSDEISSEVAVTGDVLGTGIVHINQMVRIAKAVTGQEPLEGIYLIAGDLNKNGRIDVADLTSEAKMLTAEPTPPVPEPTPGPTQEPSPGPQPTDTAEPTIIPTDSEEPTISPEPADSEAPTASPEPGGFDEPAPDSPDPTAAPEASSTPEVTPE